jgi:hypothetical protein
MSCVEMRGDVGVGGGLFVFLQRVFLMKKKK